MIPKAHTVAIQARVKGGVYTLGLLLEASDSKITTRVLRDLVTLKAAATTQGVELQVASSSDLLDKHLKELKIRRTPDLGQASYWRIYYSDVPPEAPETATQTELIQIDPPPKTPKALRLDPNFSEDVVYRDIKQIPPSIDIDKPAPWHNADPLAQDF